MLMTLTASKMNVFIVYGLDQFFILVFHGLDWFFILVYLLFLVAYEDLTYGHIKIYEDL